MGRLLPGSEAGSPRGSLQSILCDVPQLQIENGGARHRTGRSCPYQRQSRTLGKGGAQAALHGNASRRFARPDAKTYDATATFLETELDRASAAKPNPGSLPLLHRLSRTEYQNSIRDLLALDALPKEMDYSLLLPSDNISSGFDNIADLLFVSPASMERYLDAAKKISSIAVGDSEMPLMVNIHKMGPEQLQDARVDELSFGTRGGLAIRSYFPLDADYNIKLDTAGTSRDPNQIEVTVDGRARAVDPPWWPAGGRGGRGGRGGADGASPLDFRIPVKAGPRLIGVTFIEQSQARDEDTLRPRMRSRGSQPAIASVTISGPFNVTGSGRHAKP